MSDRRLKIKLQPAVLIWARERAGFAPDELAEKLNAKPERVREWESSGEISIAQIGRLARRTYTPEGWLFLDEPPDDRLPIADFRTVGGAPRRRPSPNLLETVYAMQRRQSWMRDELIEQEAPPLTFVGSHTLNSTPARVADAIRDALRLANGWASQEINRNDSLKKLRDLVEAAGVLVVFNGIVGNNTHRKLDREEFQGFALSDRYAPLVFVNNADFKAAQIFTLAHELAHLFVSETGLSQIQNMQPADHPAEKFCDMVAAEFLVPGDDLRAFWPQAMKGNNPYQTAARHFKVSAIVAARRALDLGLIERDAFFQFYVVNRQKAEIQSASGGGDFWNNQLWRIGPRFAAAVARAAQEGRLLYRDAYSLTGLTGKSFFAMPTKMGLEL